MDKQNAIKLLDETFSNDFDTHRFAKFIKELFNNFNINQQSWTVWSEYQDYIESYNSLGSYTDKSKKVIDVLIVKLKRTSSRDRARTMQRNFIAKYLGNADKNAALVAFYGDDEDWRFSFVKMEYNLLKDEEGKAKVAKELTPAKRYSFLVGINEPNHTCKRQFLELVTEDEINPSIGEIESAFSIDNVTKEFFNEYKELFLELNESLLKILEEKAYLRKEFEEKNISSVDFAKKLLGQIVFIYFLQKKGWLGVSKDDDGKFKPWGTGPKKFLRKLYDKEIVAYDNFFNDILEPLFYEALSTERDDDYYKHFNCKIPFLNGGLFEPINDYDWAGTEITLDNPIFDRILATFDRFNFTVKEDEPLEKEVAVDPEMLGKVFENLLEVKDRKSKGAFYTPREIVHYMCQQSLINYLETNSSIAREDIENFIQLGDFALAQIIKEQEQIKKYGKSYDVNEKFSIPKSIKENYKEIDKLLKEIKIVDPAVGSGAFPVGMMNEIVKARSILSIFFKEERKNYDLKREIIENCLYGVDIEPSAVEITKLRFWLSLIVDELDMKNIKPLPNLDHKIMCGNSLLEEFEGVKLFDDRLLGEVKKDYSFEIKQIDEKIALLYKDKGDIARGKKNGSSLKDIEKEIKKLERKKEDIKSKPKENERNLTLGEISEKKIKESRKKLAEHQKLQKEYFDAQNRKVKKQLREDIDRIEWELIEETLKEQGNPEAMRKLEQYKKNKAKPFFLWKLYFAEVFQRENPGFDVVIANPPYKILTINNTDSNELHMYTEHYNSIKASYSKNIFTLFIELGINLNNQSGVLSFIVPEGLFKTRSYKECVKELDKNGSVKNIVTFVDYVFENAITGNLIFLFLKNKYVQTEKLQFDGHYNLSKLVEKKEIILEKMQSDNNIFLKEVCTSFKGMVVKDRTNVLSEDSKKGKNIFLLGKSISRWRIVPKYYTDYEKLEIIGGTKRLAKHDHIPRILVRRTGDTLCCAYLEDSALTESTLYSCWSNSKNVSNKFLIGLLNSTLFDYYVKKLIVTNIQAFPQILMTDFENLPLKIVSENEQIPFISIVNKILSITKNEDYLENPDKQAKVKKLEKEIDQLVYKLYELTPEEIKIVEGSLK